MLSRSAHGQCPYRPEEDGILIAASNVKTAYALTQTDAANKDGGLSAVCEYCGCQAIPAIAQLTAEHDRARDHVRDAKTAARVQDPDAARVAAAALAHLLVPHTAVEEQALFPAMADEFPEQVRVLLGEHDLIEQALDEVLSAQPLQSGWDRRLLEAMDVLRDHILKEQDGVFPAALAILGPDDWDLLDQVRERITAKRPSTGAPEQAETIRG